MHFDVVRQRVSANTGPQGKPMTESLPLAADTEALLKALDDVKEWYLDNDRAAVVQGLRPPASPADVRLAESTFKAPFPAELRCLYDQHDGQSDREANPFFGDLVFADLDYSIGLRSGMLYAYFGVRPGGRIETTAIHCDPRTPLLPAELDGRWFPFANIQGDFLAVHLDTGRVFRAVKDHPALRLAGASLATFLGDFADHLWSSDGEEGDSTD